MRAVQHTAARARARAHLCCNDVVVCGVVPAPPPGQPLQGQALGHLEVEETLRGSEWFLALYWGL